jgi:beta-glucanase (GH16 family)
MKKLYILSIALFTLNVVNAQWIQVWSDEFTTGPTIDPTKWIFDIGNGVNGWGNKEREYYTNRLDNAIISNGNLLIIAKNEDYDTSHYTSARLKTKGLQSWKYGKIEARIKLQKGQGMWPAFWMMGDTSLIWPKCGEIDIMEHVNNNTDVVCNMFWDANLGHDYDCYEGHTICDVSQFHVYSIEWDANAIKWFVDGNKYWEGNIKDSINNTEEFHFPFYILMNAAVGGIWPGDPDSTTIFPDTTFIDYVRVYRDYPDGIKESMIIKNIINIFPNPASTQLTIEAAQLTKESNLTILNLSGQELIRQQIKDIKTQIDISNLTSGIYFVKLITDKTVEVRKILKE